MGSCSLVKELVVKHVPVNPKEETVRTLLSRYQRVSLGEIKRAPSLLVGHPNFISCYDGAAVPIHYKLFVFDYEGILGANLLSETNKFGVEQASGYELALLGQSPEFLEWIKPELNNRGENIMALSLPMEDLWKDGDPGDNNVYWTSCVDIRYEDAAITLKHFYAGKDPLKKIFPIDKKRYLIVGVQR